MEFVSIAAFYMVEPLKFLVGCADFTAKDELDVVEGGEGGVGKEDALDVAAVPGSKVGQDQGAGADLKGGVLAVDVDEIDGKFDGDAQAALRVAVGAKGIEQGVVEGGFDQGLAGIQLDWMGNLLQADVVILEVLAQLLGGRGFRFAAGATSDWDPVRAAEGHAKLAAGDLEETLTRNGVFGAAGGADEEFGQCAAILIGNDAAGFEVEAHVAHVALVADETAGVLVVRIILPGEGLPGEEGAGKVDHAGLRGCRRVSS